jgi:type II secretory pathway component PulK
MSPGRQLQPRARAGGSTLVIVLWIAFGLVSITLYFAHAMNLELRASDNRVCGLAAEQAIDGAVRYVSYVLANQPTNGLMPDPSTYLCYAVPVGDAHFWLIGRETNYSVGPTAIAFGLVDEASKLNLNTANSNMLVCLPRISLDLTQAILEWRDTNDASFSQGYYAMQQPPYQCKCAPFETVDELRLLYGADMATLVGEDANRNGVLDPNENDENHNGVLDPGVLDCVTIYSREPMTNVDGTVRLNIRTVDATTGEPLRSLLTTNLTASRTEEILQQLGLVSAAGPAQAANNASRTSSNRTPAPPPPAPFLSPLDLYLRSKMTAEEFGAIANKIAFADGAYIEGRVNINTASAEVLACLPGISDTPDLATTLLTYRESNPDKLNSIAWIADALGSENTSALAALRTNDCLTTLSFQYTADVAAVGAYGRGYHRVRFVFDTCDGTPKIIYRQDLTHLGWALGPEVRQNWLTAANTR